MFQMNFIPIHISKYFAGKKNLSLIHHHGPTSSEVTVSTSNRERKVVSSLWSLIPRGSTRIQTRHLTKRITNRLFTELTTANRDWTDATYADFAFHIGYVIYQGIISSIYI